MTGFTPARSELAGGPMAAAGSTLTACALCHTSRPLVHGAEWWNCERCGATWDAHRLEVLAAYTTFAVARDAQRRGEPPR